MPMKPEYFIGMLLLVALQFSQLVRADTHPNVLVILADDLGWNDVGYHGSEIRTPRLDALAEEGVVLDRFYAQPSCSPTRAALMTGKSPLSLGILSPLSKLNPTGLPLERRLLPEYFQMAGYQTAMVGKWHLGFRETPYLPTSRGFEHFYGNVTGGIGYWDHVHGGGLDWQRNGESLREEGYATRLTANEAVRLIKSRDRSHPMFLYAAFNAPHLPNEAPEQVIETYAGIEDSRRRVHAAMVTELDTAIGRLIDTLEAEGILENTLVWFMSDNGGLNSSFASDRMFDFASLLDRWFEGREVPITALEFVRVNVLQGGSDNRPFRKAKQSIYEGGVRVPSLIYWKGQLTQFKTEKMVTVQDVLPTLLAVIDEDASAEDFDGISQWPLIAEEADKDAPAYITHGMDGEAIYRFPWKMLSLSSGGVELYNLEEDPTEKNNLAPARAELVSSMKYDLAAAPRGESIHVLLWRSLLNMDFFGGEETLPPWAELVQ